MVTAEDRLGTAAVDVDRSCRQKEFLQSEGAVDSVDEELIHLCSSPASESLEALRRLGELLEQGASTEAVDDRGASPLIHAARCGNEQLAVRLVHAGSSLDRADVDGWTPLFHALFANNYRMTQLLVDFGADTNVRDNFGLTPHYIAATSSEPDLVKMLPPPAKESKALLTSEWKVMLKSAPRVDDRLFGFAGEAAKFLESIGCESVERVVSPPLQLGQLLTWSKADWARAGVCLSYQQRRIVRSVEEFHELPWRRGAFPDMDLLLTDSAVDGFGLTRALASFLRVAHIGSLTSRYLSLHSHRCTVTSSTTAQLTEFLAALRLLTRQIHHLQRLCRQRTTNDLPPDAVRPRHRHSAAARWPIYLSGLALTALFFTRL